MNQICILYIHQNSPPHPILSKLKKAKDEKDLDNIKELKEELETKWHGISSKLYEQSESPEEEKSDETVEDTEFEEVD